MDLPRVMGDRLGVIAGSALTPGDLTDGLVDERVVDTDRGPIRVHDLGAAVVVHRHHATGDGYRPAHLVDHHRTIAALCAAGCDRVLALASVGSLRGWPVGTMVAPFDFYAPHVNPSFVDDARGHLVPGFHEAWRDTVLAAWERATTTPLMDGGVYAQTTGPRFETPAEVRALAEHADIVGMTIASECILAGEVGLAYAAVCSVDNVANGVASTALTVEAFHDGVAGNRDRLVADVGAVLAALALVR